METASDLLCINTIRTLSIDAVQKANSGHPGTPMALAPVAYELWKDYLTYDPEDPTWMNRDRFVLSNGHASMLLYSLLYLTGVKALDQEGRPTRELAVSLHEIENFRQLNSKTPGHPEYHLVSGVETSTGPLGQGVSNSVGMAMASRWLASRYNRPGFELFSYDVYSICSDGDLMEGISAEAASIAGHLRLSNLCWIYDHNHITIEGSTELAFSEDVATRFMAYGWNVTRVSDANDLKMLKRALTIFKNTHDRPTLIIVDSHIGYGSPHKHDTKEAHGEALGEDEVKLAKKFYGWPEDKIFLVPDDVLSTFRNGFMDRGHTQHQTWKFKFSEYRKQFPALAQELDCMKRNELPTGWDRDLPHFEADSKGMATRESSGKVLNQLAKQIPWLMGGAGDLAPSTKTHLEGLGDFEAANYGGRNFHFGIREHAMGAIVNGLVLSKLRAFGSTFLIFSDYEKAAIRLSALMRISSIQIFTHDSIGLGEDGPSHQPIEQLASLRSIPEMTVFRPADANEVVEAWKHILQINGPSCMILSRQAIPTLDRKKVASAKGVQNGAYILAETTCEPELIVMATGSEVGLAMEAFEALSAKGVQVRVVSMPSWEVFERQSKEYREQVLPPQIWKRISIEAASAFGWDRYVGSRGIAIGMKTFGASAPGKIMQKHFGFSVENVLKVSESVLRGS